MKTTSFLNSSPENLNSHSPNILIERGFRLPLAQQAQLASDALIVSNLLELINDIDSRPEIAPEIDLTKVEIGIQIIEKLKKGEDYLSQRKTSLIQRPESADTVGHIRKRTGLLISENSEIVLNILNELKSWPKTQSKLDYEKLNLVKHFLRDIHTGIMDHLETSDEIDLEF